jgi:Zn-finger nucleic acid-binding protein
MPQCPKCCCVLCRIDLGGLGLHVCPECRGKLIEDERLAVLQRRPALELTQEDQDALCRQAEQSNTAGPLNCPHCDHVMDKFIYRHYDGLQVDHCSACRVYWLDAGELEKILTLYRREVDSRTPEDWARIEKMARLNLALEVQKEDTEKADADESSTSVAPVVVNLAAGLGGPVLGLLAALGVSVFQHVEQEEDIDDKVIRIIEGRPPPEPFTARLSTPWLIAFIAVLVLGSLGVYLAVSHLLAPR